MHVTRLGLRDFRSYREADVVLHPGCTTFVGLNGHGKTNLVEAIAYVATHSSHRTAKDAALVRANCDQAVISASVRWLDREQTVELEINSGRPNRARVAGAPRRPRDARGVLRAVMFAPEDLAVVRGDPGGRRRFLDELAVAVAPRAAGPQADYERALRQRNALLRSARRHRPSSDAIAVWDEQLAEAAAEVVLARVETIDALRPHLSEAYSALADSPGTLRAEYASSWMDLEVGTDRACLVSALRNRLDEVRPAELERGVTLAGPHRDDLALAIGDLPIRGYASHGESWSAALALRLASFELLRASLDTGGDPVLILDDVFAELDSRRRAHLAGWVMGAEQVLITAAVADDVPQELTGRVHTVVRDGESHVA